MSAPKKRLRLGSRAWRRRLTEESSKRPLTLSQLQRRRNWLARRGIP